ncbi:hypothetical protein I7I51_00196 [Histoplasma capsulatum]|uniref:Uncharacterized protein n=1 Tax=Ajellomyces capsulatus TaxID=5037 RepID=A0A8A1MB22_AJECA|nr:hypothetical protein I7I51_00196 [Histoplasma capsulatum]
MHDINNYLELKKTAISPHTQLRITCLAFALWETLSHPSIANVNSSPLSQSTTDHPDSWSHNMHNYGLALWSGIEDGPGCKEAERQRSATTAEKIHALEAAREVLVRRRTSLEKQINDLRTRQENRRRNEKIGDSGRPR